MIDVTTAGDDGHWDHPDIKRLCEYRDALRSALIEATSWMPAQHPNRLPYLGLCGVITKSEGAEPPMNKTL